MFDAVVSRLKEGLRAWRRRSAVLSRGLIIGSSVGALCGLASAAFLFLLDAATRSRMSHEWLVCCLPAAGLLMGMMYERMGVSLLAGNNLIIDAIHDNGPKIPIRMAPMVLVGTLVTHLFGGSAGREGTAVQMGASLADTLAHVSVLGRRYRGHFLSAGVAGGFGSVFGTPISGMIFGLEFVVLGRLDYAALLPTLVASLVGDMTTRGLGIKHVVLPAVQHVDLTLLTLAKWAIFSAAAAATAAAFVALTHLLKKWGAIYVPQLHWRMAAGGATMVLLWQVVGSSDYLGLGVAGLTGFFTDSSAPPYAFALKLLFTAVTLGTGFIGGEVTPLFFAGAALGNTLAQLLNVPLALGAGLGMAAVFACAANTPLALSVMVVELMGAQILPHAAVVCILAYMLSSQHGIYTAQRIARDKLGVLSTLTRP